MANFPERVDVLVVGAGPAGSCAARQAASAGLDVLIVDRKSRAGEPMQCAEFVPRPAVQYLDDTACVVQQATFDKADQLGLSSAVLMAK